LSEANQNQSPEDAASVKKPRQMVKLLTTPKTTNGASTPKAAKELSAVKSAKSTKAKAKKATKTPETPEVVAPKEPELTAEQKADIRQVGGYVTHSSNVF